MSNGNLTSIVQSKYDIEVAMPSKMLKDVMQILGDFEISCRVVYILVC